LAPGGQRGRNRQSNFKRTRQGKQKKFKYLIFLFFCLWGSIGEPFDRDLMNIHRSYFDFVTGRAFKGEQVAAWPFRFGRE
jgi:hypothetical protein